MENTVAPSPTLVSGPLLTAMQMAQTVLGGYHGSHRTIIVRSITDYVITSERKPYVKASSGRDSGETMTVEMTLNFAYADNGSGCERISVDIVSVLKDSDQFEPLNLRIYNRVSKVIRTYTWEDNVKHFPSFYFPYRIVEPQPETDPV